MSIEIKNDFTLHWKVLDNTTPYVGVIKLSEDEIKNLDFDALLAKQTEEFNKAMEARKLIAEQTPTDTTTV